MISEFDHHLTAALENSQGILLRPPRRMITFISKIKTISTVRSHNNFYFSQFCLDNHNANSLYIKEDLDPYTYTSINNATKQYFASVGN